MYHILLVEDAVTLGETITSYLEHHQYTVIRTQTIAQAKIELTQHLFDCAIIDRMLPDGEGHHLCHHIKTQYHIPTILSTAKSQIEDKLEGFESGADDYLVKPYDLRELQARIIALTKRQDNDIAHTIIGDISITTETMEITQAGQSIHCTSQERIVLKLLLETPNVVVSRSDLIDYIRGGEGTRGFENKLDVLISGIRKKLGKDFITTIKGLGYKIEQS